MYVRHQHIMVPYNCQRIVITIIFMVSGSCILPSLGKEVGRKEGLLAYSVGGTLETVPKPWDRRTAGCSPSWRPLSAAPPTLPRSNKFPFARPARAPQADPAPPPRSLINSLSNPPGVEIPAANALPRRESPQHAKERSPRWEGGGRCGKSGQRD